jgi:hypothetical protein
MSLKKCPFWSPSDRPTFSRRWGRCQHTDCSSAHHKGRIKHWAFTLQRGHDEYSHGSAEQMVDLQDSVDCGEHLCAIEKIDRVRSVNSRWYKGRSERALVMKLLLRTTFWIGCTAGSVDVLRDDISGRSEDKAETWQRGVDRGDNDVCLYTTFESSSWGFPCVRIDYGGDQTYCQKMRLSDRKLINNCGFFSLDSCKDVWLEMDEFEWFLCLLNLWCAVLSSFMI